ncbi:Pyrimidine-nucleoside phosphorylase [Syntrophomonas zehnderi OL-4]|uniref:Pyrimidine-nucleoside phosphorylase n=1 Tax=Syntrophomonas zehnderi OL-4 TaxID=690567 RepID=A0A0E4GAZ6_9FIRM|nr:thymidine phosphorylase [Syntrophomonas zehnderi]CFX51014.1 Pyrimidine-nucleoside phosphorylase [Syntrophomonas zehnderi OL-4]
MNVVDIITKKRNGLTMTRSEIDYMVKGISEGTIPDYQIAAWAMAVYFQGMDIEETRDLTLAMAYSGEVMDLAPIQGFKVDKHSTGGVGDKTTLIAIALAAAAGIPVAKMSGRGLGHTGGTVDKFESIPGFRVELSRREFIEQVNTIKAALISQSGNLVPADKRLYAIRDVTATVESIPLIASSIISKKIAAGAQGIVLDVKVGRGAFMKDLDTATQLARTMVEIGKGAGREVVAVLTDMNQPLGYNVGNALEVAEALDLLRGQGAEDLKEVSLILTAHMLVLAGKHTDFQAAREELQQLLATGQAFQKFTEIVAAQGGRLDFSLPFYDLPQASHKEELIAREEGYVVDLDALKVGHAAMLLGAGREQLDDHIDPSVGVQLVKKYGDFVKKGDVLAVMHVNDINRLALARQQLQEAFTVGPAQPVTIPLVYKTVLSQNT